MRVSRTEINLKGKATGGKGKQGSADTAAKSASAILKSDTEAKSSGGGLSGAMIAVITTVCVAVALIIAASIVLIIRRYAYRVSTLALSS